jgi:hypothetical protein
MDKMKVTTPPSADGLNQYLDLLRLSTKKELAAHISTLSTSRVGQFEVLLNGQPWSWPRTAMLATARGIHKLRFGT